METGGRSRAPGGIKTGHVPFVKKLFIKIKLTRLYYVQVTFSIDFYLCYFYFVIICVTSYFRDSDSEREQLFVLDLQNPPQILITMGDLP